MVVVVGVCIRCAGVIFNSKSPIDLKWIQSFLLVGQQN